MLKIESKKDCCGCGACSQKCPKGCIELRADEEGFFYPEVDMSTCIECGLCEKSCPMLYPYQRRKPLSVYAVINPAENIRKSSSSGGIFSFLAEKIINMDGCVFGARYDHDWQVIIGHTETKEGVSAFRGSKYVQAKTSKSYGKCKEYLEAGRQVLYMGTPCQISGLHHYLKKSYSNLLAVDFICHGAPSPKVWKKYLDEVLMLSKPCIQGMNIRDKRNEWKKSGFTINAIDDSNGIELTSPYNKNPYMEAFLWDLTLRPSCYACKAKNGMSHADITIGDFWGIGEEHPEMDDDKGTSVVMINTEKGKEFLNLSELKHIASSYSVVCKHNPAVCVSAVEHRKRNYFFSCLDRKPIVDLIWECLEPTMLERIKSFRLYLRKLRQWVLGGKGKNRNIDIVFVNAEHRQMEGRIKHVNFRDKRKSWEHYNISIEIE